VDANARWQEAADPFCVVHRDRRRHPAVCDRVSVGKRVIMIKELDSVILTADLPERGLRRGDVGTVVLVHRQGAGYEVEFMALDGETIDVVTMFASQVRPVGQREIAHARLVSLPS